MFSTGPPRVGMAAAYFATMKGGGEHYTLHICDKLDALGFDITIICGKQPFKRPEPLSDRHRIEYVPQLYFLRDIAMRGIKTVSRVALLLHSRQYSFFCYRHLLRSHDFDIIHTHDPASLNAATKIKRKLGIPVVATFHGFPTSRHMKYAENVDAILAVSGEIRAVFEKHGMKKVHTLPGGVDLSFFKPLNKERCREQLGLAGKILLFVGRLIPAKNLHSLLFSFARVQHKIGDANLLMIGDGILKNSLMNTASKLGIKEKVKFIEAVSHEDLPIYYNAADVFVLPSFFESFSLVSLEAIACGVPVVISTGAKAFIEGFGKECFFLVNPKEIDSISDGIIQALTIEDEIRRKTDAGLKRVRKYDWMEVAKEIAKIYKSILL